MRASEYSVVSGKHRAVLAGQLGVTVDCGQRGAQFVAGVGDELAHPAIRRRDIGQRPLDVVEQSVQRVTDQADLRARIGVPVRHPRRDRVVVAVQRQRRHFGGRRGDPAQRTKREPDDRDRAQRQ